MRKIIIFAISENIGIKPAVVCMLALLLLSSYSEPSVAARNEDKNIGWPGKTLMGAGCKGKAQGFGPFDYTDVTYVKPGLYTRHGSKTESPLKFVEKAHFLPEIENLQEQAAQKKYRKNLPGNIDYTLRAFPNHHRALYSLIGYQMRYTKDGVKTHPKLPEIAKGMPPAECYFNRAEAFAPEDSNVWMLHGLYLHRRGLHREALTPYLRAEEIAPYDAQLIYNLGLLYFDLGRYSEAKEKAIRARELGFPMPGLTRKLEQSGHW